MALAFTAEGAGPSLFARLSWRAAAAAGLLAVAAVVFNFSAITGAFDESAAAAPGDDPVSEVVDVGS